MFRFFERAINCGLICGLVALVPVTIGSAAARGERFNQLYDFCSRQDCADGFWPEDGLGSDKDGSLYGTASSGGTTCAGIGCGTIFKLTPDGREITLYSFCSDRNCTGGYRPDGGVIVDTKGNIFGTTALGANYAGDCSSLGCGAVFKLATDGTLTVLHAFKDSDGLAPEGALTMDGKGNLYGTTIAGGTFGGGTVFEITPRGVEKLRYSFCARAGCADGAGPVAGVVLDQAGDLYGTTAGGGGTGCDGRGCGVVFKLASDGTESVLHNFCSQKNCADGAYPRAGLTIDEAENLYGTTAQGGACHRENCTGHGTVFRIAPDGVETVLYSFCSRGEGCADGAIPYAGVVADPAGNLYGTTAKGGRYGYGTAFRLTPDDSETVLHNFCSQSHCDDGKEPVGSLIADRKGNLYGTTFRGGANACSHGCGIIFRLKP